MTEREPKTVEPATDDAGTAEDAARAALHRDLFESASEPALILDAIDGVVVDANHAARALFGAERGQLVGVRVVTLSPGQQPDGRESLSAGRAFCEQADALGDARFEWMHHRLDGTPLPVTVLLSTFTSGERLLYRARLHDRREQIEVEAELAGALEQAAQDAELRHVAEVVKIGLMVGRFADTRSMVMEYVSSAAKNVLGRFVHENVMPLDGLLRDMHPEDRLAFGDAWMSAYKGATPVDLEVRIRREDDTWQALWIASTPLARADGQRRWFHLIRDVSDAKEAADEVRTLRNEAAELQAALFESNRSLEAANTALDSFTHSVSEELRAPARRVDGLVRLFVDTHGAELDEAGLDVLERVRRCGEDMRTLIDAIMKLSRVHRHSMELEFVDLSLLVRRYAEQYKSFCTWNIEDNIVVYGDASLLRAAMIHLLENALKFTSKSSAPHIWFGTGEREGKRCIELRDNGIGFDGALAERIFLPFGRLHRQADFEGFGMGLATVKRIFDLHSAQYGAESAPGEGTTLWFRLPHPQSGAGTEERQP